MTWRLTLAAVLAPIVLALAASGQGLADRSLRDVQFVAVRADGAILQLQFVIEARSELEATEAALAAARELVPGATILGDEPGKVAAQFAPWWWQWDAAELPVPVAYNSLGAVAGVTAEDVARELEAWGNVESSSFGFRYGGVTSADATVREGVNDGQNVVAWAHLDCQGGCVLGVTTKTEAHEADIVLNNNPEARLGDGSNRTVDTRSILLHELGHLAGLEHSCPLFSCTKDEQDAVMYFQYRGLKRELRADDIAGVSALYPARQPTEGVQQSELDLSLQPGWMLTALPPGPIEETARSLGCVDAVYAYDGQAWHTWLRGAHPALQELTSVEPGAAYWLHASAACSHLFELAH